MENRIRPLNKEEILHLIAVGRKERPATVWIKDGMVANLYTGELERLQIALHGRRIAYIGPKEPKVDEETTIIDASQYTLVPGYIEPHAHPFQIYNPVTFADYIMQKGTTTCINDNIMFYGLLSMDEWVRLMEELSRHPVKMLWWCRLESQSSQKELIDKFQLPNIAKLLDHPLVIQGGELTQWIHLLQGDGEMAEKIAILKEKGKRLEGHAPGASLETLNLLAAAGITSDHEAITAEEVMRRLKVGMYAPLRHSSIRPDLPELINGLKELRYGWERLMLTTDGSTPPFMEQGFTDALIRIALESGVEPIWAYRMASLNVATYYGLDEQIGSLAPGRLADILFLESIENPTPIRVMVEGKLVVNETGIRSEPSKQTIDWESFHLKYHGHSNQRFVTADNFRIPWEEGKPFPVIHLINDVITIQQELQLPVKNGYLEVPNPELMHIALIDKHGRWISRGLLSGFANGLDALATTFTLTMDYLVIGSNYDAMEKALHFVMEKSGIAIVERDQIIQHIPLPIGGGMSDLPMNELIGAGKKFISALKERGFPHDDPFYCLLFLTSTHLPKLRITENGIVSVKDRTTLLPANAL